MNDRIKLAEAMGWTIQVNHPDGVPIWVLHDSPHNYCEANELPNPFTDANDDYAVLEWIRSQHFITHMAYFLDADTGLAIDYKIGDYARAALKVIENE